MDTKRVLRNTLVSLLALAGGMIGGFVHNMLSQKMAVQAQTVGEIRATALELVDRDGNRVGYLGTDTNRNTSLVFFDARGKKRAEFGLGRGENPRLDINGPDGYSRLSLDLGRKAVPRLMMSDPDFNARVYLGVVEPDSPSPDWKYDSWVLRFTGDNTRPLAMIGMITGERGGVGVYDHLGHMWQPPPLK